MIPGISSTIAERWLEPGDSLSELLFGLIMTPTFTLGAGLMLREDPTAARDLLIATIGCNVAWGIIDGALYVSGQLFERARLARVGRNVREAASEEAAAAIVEALRVSNAILITLLFVTGFSWARYTTLRPWATGLTFVVAGVALVAMAIALGG